MKRASRLSRCVDTGVEFVEVVSVDTGVEVSSGVERCRAVSGGSVGVSSQGSTHQLLFRSVALPRLIPARRARFSRSVPACLRRDANQHPWCPSTTSGAAGGGCRGAKRPIEFGWCCAVPRRAAVPARWRVARDDAFASDDDFWVYEHLRVVNFLPVYTFIVPTHAVDKKSSYRPRA